MFRWDDWEFTRPAADGPFCVDGRVWWPWWIDRRHVELVYRLAMLGSRWCALEIGARRGSSTSALVQALKDGGLGFLTVADPARCLELDRVLAAGGDLCEQYVGSGVDCLRAPVRFVLWDGDHSVGIVREEWAAVSRLAPDLIVAHDVCAGDVAGCEGPAQVLPDVLNDGRWACWVDGARRPGEWTERGLLVAVRRGALEAAVEAEFRAMVEA